MLLMRSQSPIEDVKTPAFIIDRSIFESNCAGMIRKAKEWGADFRAHLKTHKASEFYDIDVVVARY